RRSSDLPLARHAPAELHRRRPDARAAAAGAECHRRAPGAVRRSGAAGAHPHRHRHRLRPARVHAGAGAPRARDARHRRRRRGREGTVTLPVLPILVPMGTAAVLMLAPRRPLLQRWIALSGAALQLAAAIALFLRVEAQGIQVLQVGSWPAPFGITLAADLLSAILVVAVGVVGVAVTASAFAGVDPRREAFGY